MEEDVTFALLSVLCDKAGRKEIPLSVRTEEAYHVFLAASSMP